ncbi:MAG: segregation/condensation protein A [Bdellovibrionaceae bacterium]|nr:segregation/condensation protein A [Pseudobdellovibrionaceae bacterium]
MGYLVHLQKFEGPMGLLLYLIRKEEMDIFDININEITRQYLDYIRMMKELDLEVAGEFVAMAATLIHIKSRMLLPQYNEVGEVVEQEDPRKELVQKLLEYQRYQDAAKQLYERPILGRDVWPSAMEFDFNAQDDGQGGAVITEEDGLFSLIASYRKAIKRMNRAVHNVRAKVQSIASRIMEMKDRLIVGSRVRFGDFINTSEGPQRRGQVLITFLSLLELGRMGFVHLFQNETYGEIYVEARKPVEGNVMERVQEFENIDAEDVAQKVIDDAMEERLEHEGEQLAREENESDPQLALDAGVESERPADAGAAAATDEEILAAEMEMDMGTSELAEGREKLQAEHFETARDVGSEPEAGSAMG